MKTVGGNGRRRVRATLLGSAAPCIAVSLAIVLCPAKIQAAPVEYVRVCDAFGAAFFYIPGTDTCGYAGGIPGRTETQYGTILTVGPSGSGAVGYGQRSFSIGTNSSAFGDHAFSGGDPFSASPGPLGGAGAIDGQAPLSAFTNSNTTAIGQASRAGAGAAGQDNATAIGQGAIANALNATALGQGATASAGSLVLGQGAQDNGTVNSVVLGQGASVATGLAGANVAIGQGTVVSRGAQPNYTGYGLSATQASAGEAAFATTTGNRQLTGVAAGIASSDAVNVGQLQAVGASVATALGAGASFNPATGAFTTPSYQVQGTTYNSVGGAVTALDAAVTTATAGSNSGAVAGQVVANSASIAALQTGQAGAFRTNNASSAADPLASGSNGVAGGYGAVASGSSSTAVGTNAKATQAGATAFGAGAVASGDPTTAVGFNAAATGDEASAFGAFASATGTNSTALGRSATASATAATAVGYGASATGANAIAIGQGATATQANSVAIGTGVATTRANQVALGTAAQTYTLAGVPSAASLAAQSGTTNFVTTDASGNLAASTYGPTSLAALDGRVGNLEAGMNALNRYAVETRREARQGIAAAMALASAPLPSAPGRLSYVFNGSTFRGEYGIGGSVAYRLDTTIPLAITAGVAGSTGRNVGARIGIMGEL